MGDRVTGFAVTFVTRPIIDGAGSSLANDVPRQTHELCAAHPGARRTRSRDLPARRIDHQSDHHHQHTRSGQSVSTDIFVRELRVIMPALFIRSLVAGGVGVVAQLSVIFAF